VVLAGLFLTPAPGASGATTRQSPGSAPCDTTLQACIDGADPGDRIEIVTNTPIHESLDVEKSVTVTAGAGFHPIVGGGSSVLEQEVRDGDGTSVSVTFSKISFLKAQISVVFTQHTGNRFALLNSKVTHALPNNNETGVDVDIRVGGAIARVVGNFLKTTGQTVNVDTAMPNPGDHASVLVAGNTATTSDFSNSYHGITMSLGGTGTADVDVFSNVFHHLMGCSCGGTTVASLTVFDSVEANVNLVGNTIDHAGPDSTGIEIDAPSGTSRANVTVFDNVVSATPQAGILLPAATPRLNVLNGFNDFFGGGAPPDFGGYPMGAMTLSVNPQYVRPSAGNYHLRVGSPLRDAGQTCNPGGLSRADAARRFRVAGRNVDIGAFEIDAGPVPPGVNLFGTAESETLNGTAGADVICGMLGADTVRGLGGGDRLFGGRGGDDLIGGPGEDWLTGGPGFDDLLGGTGRDHLDGLDHAGVDDLDGGRSDDICLRDSGDTVTSCP